MVGEIRDRTGRWTVESKKEGCMIPAELRTALASIRVTGDKPGHEFHGNQWDNSKLGQELSAKTWLHGTGHAQSGVLRDPIFLTTDSDAADWYAQNRGDGHDQIVPIKVNVKNPITVDSYDDAVKLSAILNDAGIQSSVTNGEHGWSWSLPPGDGSPYDGNNPLDVVYHPEARRALVDAGFDAVYSKHDEFLNGSIDALIPLNAAEQIKGKFSKRSLGEHTDHAFHGNQWTAAGVPLSEKELNTAKKYGDIGPYKVQPVIGDDPRPTSMVESMKREVNVMHWDLQQMTPGRPSTVQMQKQYDGFIERIARLEPKAPRHLGEGAGHEFHGNQWNGDYVPNHDAPVKGEWDRSGDEPRWHQQHAQLVKDALQHWVGDSSWAHIHIADALVKAPIPSSGGGKEGRTQAEALLWELANKSVVNDVPLYRGSSGKRFTTVESWSEKKSEAEKWAKLAKGPIETLPAGTAKGLRLRDYAKDAFGEKQWIIQSDLKPRTASWAARLARSLVTVVNHDMLKAVVLGGSADAVLRALGDDPGHAFHGNQYTDDKERKPNVAIPLVCAWCKKDMGTTMGEAGKVSHGMCDECQKKQFDEMDEEDRKAGRIAGDSAGHAFHGNQWTKSTPKSIPPVIVMSIGQVSHDGSVDSREYKSSMDNGRSVTLINHSELFRPTQGSQRFRMHDKTVWWDDTPSADDYFSVENHYAKMGAVVERQKSASQPWQSLDPRTLGDNAGHEFHGNQWTNGGHVHESITRLQQKYPDVAARYEQHSGTEMGSVISHTKDVGRVWEKQISPAELNDISTRWGSDVGKLMNDAIALHDIGKGEAVQEGDKDAQHEFTVPILKDVLTKEGYSPKDVALATELLNHDMIGKLMQGRGDLLQHEIAAEIVSKAETIGMLPHDFAKLQLAVYHSDAGAYPFVVHNFMKVDKSGKLSMKKFDKMSDILALHARYLGGEAAGHDFHGNQWTGGGSNKIKFPPSMKRTGANIKDVEWKDHAYDMSKTEEKVAINDIFGTKLDTDNALFEAERVGKSLVADANEKFDMTVDVGSYSIKYGFEGENGTRIAYSVSRDDDTHELVVDHTYFEVLDANQGKGIAKEVLRSNFAEYERLGVDRVELNADIDSGKYAWARFGYVPASDKDAAKLYGELASRVKSSGAPADLELELAAEAKKPHPNPELLWKVADSPDGFKLLAGAKSHNWNGTFNLKNEHQTDRLAKYLSAKPKKRAAGEGAGHEFHGNQWTDNSWRSDPYAHVPDTLFRGSVNKPFDEVLRETYGGELGGGVYFTADYDLARTYGGGPTASFEGGTRAVHEAEWVRKPEPHEVAYMEGLDKDYHMSRLIDGNGKELWRGEWPGSSDLSRSHFPERDAMYQAAKNGGIKVMIGLNSSFATNQISVLDKSMLKLKQTLALPVSHKPHYEPLDPSTNRYYPKYRIKSTAPNQPSSPTSRFMGLHPEAMTGVLFYVDTNGIKQDQALWEELLDETFDVPIKTLGGVGSGITGHTTEAKARKEGDFLFGGCASFAVALQQTIGGEIHVLYHDGVPSGPRAYHAYVEKDGKKFDVKGQRGTYGMSLSLVGSDALQRSSGPLTTQQLSETNLKKPDDKMIASAKRFIAEHPERFAEPKTLGDKPGHDFHGNQWGVGLHSDGTVTLLHGTTKLNADSILKEGFKSGAPATVAAQIEKEYGLPKDSVLKNVSFQFASGRGDLDRVHLTSDPDTAAQYSIPEVLQDALSSVWSIQHPDIENFTRDLAQEKSAWVKSEAARLTQPDVLAVRIPWSTVGDHAFGKKISLDEFKNNKFLKGDLDILRTVSIPMSAMKDAVITRADKKLKALGEQAGHEFHGNQWADGSKESTRQDQIYALNSYSSGYAYSINTALRTGKPPDDSEEHVEIKSVIPHLDAAMQPSPTGALLYRVTDDIPTMNLQPGQEFIDHAFVSTTTNRKALEDIASDVELNDNHMILAIHAPEGTRMLDVNKNIGVDHMYAYQKEVILARDQKFRVTGRTGSTIHMQVIQ
jgi:GNAT superfamily N-acetyltransferase